MRPDTEEIVQQHLEMRRRSQGLAPALLVLSASH